MISSSSASLAVEVVVEPGLRHAEGAGDVAHRGGGKTAIAEDLRSGPADFDPARRLWHGRGGGAGDGLWTWGCRLCLGPKGGVNGLRLTT